MKHKPRAGALGIGRLLNSVVRHPQLEQALLNVMIVERLERRTRRHDQLDRRQTLVNVAAMTGDVPLDKANRASFARGVCPRRLLENHQPIEDNLIVLRGERATHAHLFGSLADHELENIMNRPYMLPIDPPATYTDGEPYTFTVMVSDKGYHDRFHECYIVYELPVNGFTYQVKWEMIRCKIENWGNCDSGPKSIEVVVLARNPIPFEPGCLLGVLLGLLPKPWRAKIIRGLRRKGAGRGLGDSGGGQGTIYGSNDQDATDDSSSSSASSGSFFDSHPYGVSRGSAPSAAGASTSRASSSSTSSSSSSAAGGRRFRRHQEVESWFVTKAKDCPDQAYKIDEA
jgi:hypothetical protein